MTINLTLVVQIIHFIIAYFIISRILLKPAIAIIKDEKKERDDFSRLILNTEADIKSKELLKKSLWQGSLRQFKASQPDIEKPILGLSLKTPKALTFAQDSVEKIKQDLTTFVINKVQDV